MSSQIKDVMTKNLLTIPSGESLSQALSMMRERRIRHIPVTDDNGAVIGILSDRDFTVLDALAGLKVDHAMSSPALFVHQETSLRSAALKMLENKISSLLIADDDNRAVGIVTTEDLLWQLAHLMKDDPAGDEEKTSIWSYFNKVTLGQIADRLSGIGL